MKTNALKQDLIRRSAKYRKPVVSLNSDQIMNQVLREFNVPLELLQSSATGYKASTPRQTAQLFLMLLPGSSCRMAGELTGNRHPSSVEYSLKTACSLYQTSRTYKAHLDNIRDRLRILPEEMDRHMDRWRRE